MSLASWFSFTAADDNRAESLFKKLLVLFLVSLVTTILYFPSLTFVGYSYETGDVALSDVKSPVAIESDGISVKKGEMIVRDGQVITEGDLKKVSLISSAIRDKSRFLPAAGFFAFTAVLIAMSYLFASRNIRKFSTATKDLLLMGVIFIGVAILLRASDAFSLAVKSALPGPMYIYKYLVPVAVGPMLVRLLLNSEIALVFAAVTSIMAGLFMGGELDYAAYSLIGGVVAAMGVRHCTHRSIVIRAGLILGAVNAGVLLSMAALKGAAFQPDTLYIIGTGFFNGIITSIIAVGTAPVLESAFQYTTNIKLLELSRMDHPLLKELAIRAPGTYHHSLVIGTLAEAAAASINANPLLARVASYYHDAGKLKMPLYFIENISDENRHDKLAPSMSALVLVSHIKEGVELAEENRLGQEIIDIIREHHGTSLISYFYQKAKSMEGGGEVDEKSYRYPGPKPQTKEAGIVMLADAIEAASKTIPDPTPDKIQWLTQKIVNKIFTDGQLDECELTLKDLHAITRSFNRVFAGIYHQRIDYPEPAYIVKEGGSEGAGRRQVSVKEAEDKKDGRDGLKRLGI
ncbi:MAG: HDIG domain-containing protein [Deltaproteobacteria bacterium]|nr:HDIG domain-containing protein [Deltaproteobacteria bacterium]